MLAFLSNVGPLELVIVLVIAVLIFGKDLPQAASKAYAQARKLRNAVDDLRRDSGIDRELRDIERSVREAEWEARKAGSGASLPRSARTIAAAPSALPPGVSEVLPASSAQDEKGLAGPDEPRP